LLFLVNQSMNLIEQLTSQHHRDDPVEGARVLAMGGAGDGLTFSDPARLQL